MGYLKTAVAVVLAGMLAAPALAGVTGAEGGTGTVTTKVEKVYDGSRTVDKNVQTNTSTAVSGGTAVHIKYWVGGRGDGKGLGSLLPALRNWVGGGADPGPGWNDYYETVSQSGLSGGEIRSLVKNTVDTNGRGIIFDTVGSTSSSSQSSSTSQTGPVYVGDTYLKTTSTQDTNKTPNVIVVGDPDALAAAYVAQGTVTQTTNIQEHYRKEYVNTITTNVHTTTYYQTNVRAAVSPIVLDLDRDGKLQASAGKWMPHVDSFDKTRVALFDFHANGFPVLTEWVGPQDGLLVRPHADGSVDGSCLFGTFGGFQNGYEALRTLDVDGNGQVQGAELQGLKVWQDGNSDAIVDNGELLTLDELGITSLGVQHDQMRGTFVRDGQTCQSFDWWPSVVEMRKKDMNQNV